MSPTRTLVLLLSTSLASLAAAQQSLLVNGNSNLPACAQTCQALIQGSQACAGTGSPTSVPFWACFCQSAYLTSLKTAGSNLCSASCSSTADNDQISKWYTTNCGSDNGASENHGDSSAATTTSPADGASSTDAGAAATSSSSSSSSSGSSSNQNTGNGSFNAGANQTGQDWWSSHYQYIIMLIILVIALPLLAWLAIWLKRRHDRKMDQMSEGFNAGITERAAPAPMSDPHLSGGTGSGIDGSGRNSPARTRDAYMPFGYGYTRSESRLGSRQAVNDTDRGSPLARGETDPEKDAGTDKRSRRVLVRERSTEDDIQREKR